jgi:hypothetical protein
MRPLRAAGHSGLAGWKKRFPCGELRWLDMWWKVIGGLLALWLVIAVAGWLIKTLFWLAVIGGVLFVATAAIGWARREHKQLK